jgi:hypothetical protein
VLCLLLSECRDAVGLPLLDERRGGVSYAFRLLRQSPTDEMIDGQTSRQIGGIATQASG